MKSVVIIGGGIGGLFTGAILSHEGLNVTILEKNINIGGGLQSFSRFGEVFDAGMHIIGGLYEGGSVRRICQYLGVLDKMHVRSVDDDCIDQIYIGEEDMTYKIAKGREGFINSLASYFPEERDNIKRYVDRMFQLTEEVKLFHLQSTHEGLIESHTPDFLLPVGQFIRKYTDNKKLQSILAYMNPLYGGKVTVTPAYIHSIINVLYINGACRFVGGSCRFAELLRQTIEENGGRVLTNSGVASISTMDRHILSLKTVGGLSYHADYYISAVHPCNLFGLFEDKKALPKAYRTRLENIPNTYSAFSIYLKLKPNCIRYINHTCYIMRRYDDVWKLDDTDDRWPVGLMYMTTPEENQGIYATKMIVTLPMKWNEVKRWEDTTIGERGEEYHEWKNGRAETMLQLMTTVYPDFLDCIDSINTASPLTIRDYYGVKDGTMYGFQKDGNNIIMSQVPVVTKIPNLLLTGQNINLHGFCGVSLTAVSTCEAILGENYLIRRFNKTENPQC